MYKRQTSVTVEKIFSPEDEIPWYEDSSNDPNFWGWDQVDDDF